MKKGFWSRHNRYLRKKEEMSEEERQEELKKKREYWHKNKNRFKLNKK